MGANNFIANHALRNQTVLQFVIKPSSRDLDCGSTTSGATSRFYLLDNGLFIVIVLDKVVLVNIICFTF
jgi:hypothetical protein